MNFDKSSQSNQSFACEIVHFDDNGREYKLRLMPIIRYMVYFQHHLKCQNITDAGGDNEF